MTMAVVTAAFALLAAGGAADAQSTVCDGIDNCIAAPATPVVVAVTATPTTYQVNCPNGYMPVQLAVSTQGGVLATNVPSQGNAWDDPIYTPGVAATVPAVPAVTTTTTAGGTIAAGASGTSPTFYDNAVGSASGAITQVDRPINWGSGPPPGEQATAAVTAPTGSIFTASVPPTVPTSASGDTPEVPFSMFPPTNSTWQVNLSGWTWMTAATMTPSVGCTPAPASRKRVAQHRVAGDRAVPPGRATHWFRCPAGTTRVGDLEHAVYVPNRSRLTVAERRAIDSRLVRTAGGGEHVETRLGAHAPDGVRVQLHATCRG
jgi:hypothetical protein